MTPPPQPRRFGSERLPLSPVRNPPQSAAPNVALHQAVSHASSLDKENVQGHDSNDKIFEDVSKPILITFEGESQEVAPPKKLSAPSSLGRPPTIRHAEPEKVRLCAELAGKSLYPAGIAALMFIFLAASHSDEDHSFDAIYRAFGRTVEDLQDDDSWAMWALIVFVGILIVAGLASMYILYTSEAGPARPSKAKGRVAPREDAARSLTVREARRRSKLGEVSASSLA